MCLGGSSNLLRRRGYVLSSPVLPCHGPNSVGKQPREAIMSRTIFLDLKHRSQHPNIQLLKSENVLPPFYDARDSSPPNFEGEGDML